MTPKHRSTGPCQVKRNLPLHELIPKTKQPYKEAYASEQQATIETEDRCSDWIELSQGDSCSEEEDDLGRLESPSPICTQESVIVPARACSENWANAVSTGMYKVYCTSTDRPWRVDGGGKVKADGRGSVRMERIVTTDTGSSDTYYSFKHAGKYVTAVESHIHYRLKLLPESGSPPEMRRFRTVIDDNSGQSGFILVPEFSSGLAVIIGRRGGLKLIGRHRQRDLVHWDFQ